MKQSQLNRLKSALVWVKNAVILSVIVYSAIMADIIFHNSSEFRTILTLPKSWLAISIPLVFVIWMKISIKIMHKNGITRCLIVTLGLIVVALVLLHFASPPIINATIWISPTLQIARTYPYHFNAWVNFCALLGMQFCAISGINLILY